MWVYESVFVYVIVGKVGKDEDVLVNLVDVELLIYNFESLFRTLKVPFQEVRFLEIVSWELGIKMPCDNGFQGTTL